MRPIPAFINPAGGSADAAREVLRDDPRFVVREVAPDALRAALRAEVEAGTPRVLVSGGDGTVATAVSALLETDVELAVLPGGTLNHFARDVGLPRDDLRACAELAATGSARPVDVGAVNDEIFVNTSAMGAYVTFVRTRERYQPVLGYYLASVVAAFRTWLGLNGFDVLVRDDHGERRYHTPLLSVAVGERELERHELGARIPDGARALHVLVLRETARARLLARALLVVARGARVLQREGDLTARLEPAFETRTRRALPTVSTDGELRRMTTPLRYRLLRDAVRVVAPPAGAPREAAAPEAATSGRSA